ncbi:alpha/beta fold hydrolase [Jannaschia sp. CCS1]|uniref:alpha/beta fold hydrolase n=1 Tax=Jannaschia sp. (strain CCS1) TaxID=290400 RepID=UPI0002E9FECE|nr:alpha/beta fold hydrolase [Jannaschia sp. CCS1]
MIYRFADVELDVARHRLTRGDADVHVEPQVFDLITALARVAPNLLSYDAMIAEIWGGRIVSDATLSARVSAARTALGDNGRAQAIIRTVPRRGVQMAVPVTGMDTGMGTDTGGQTAPQTGVQVPRQVIRFARSQDGTSIAYATSGDEGPTLVRGGHWISHLEHDWDNPVWRPLLTRLNAGRRLIRFDPRGSGLSDRTPPSMGLDASVADLHAVLDVTAQGGSQTPVDVIAVSQSAPVALAHAARYPERIGRLILVNGFAQGSLARGDIAGTDTLLSMIRAGWGVPGSPFVKAFATLFLPQGTAEEVAGLVEMQGLSASAEGAAILREAIGRFDVSDLLDRVQAPVLVLSSEGDAIHPSDQSRLLARRLPNAEFQSLPTANHVVAPSDPAFDIMLDATDAFLAR